MGHLITYFAWGIGIFRKSISKSLIAEGFASNWVTLNSHIIITTVVTHIINIIVTINFIFFIIILIIILYNNHFSILTKAILLLVFMIAIFWSYWLINYENVISWFLTETTFQLQISHIQNNFWCPRVLILIFLIVLRLFQGRDYAPFWTTTSTATESDWLSFQLKKSLINLLCGVCPVRGKRGKVVDVI